MGDGICQLYPVTKLKKKAAMRNTFSCLPNCNICLLSAFRRTCSNESLLPA